MRIRITPLNIVAAAAVLGALLLGFDQLEMVTFKLPAMKILFTILMVVIAVVAFISDIIFRKMIPSLKRLWLIEVSLITLTVVMTIVLRALIG